MSTWNPVSEDWIFKIDFHIQYPEYNPPLWNEGTLCSRRTETAPSIPPEYPATRFSDILKTDALKSTGL